MPEEISPQEVPEEDAALDTAFTDAGADPVAETAAQEVAAPSPLFERAKSLGMDLGDIDSNDKLAEFLLTKYQESQPYIQAGQHFLSQPKQADPTEEEEQDDDGGGDFDSAKYFTEKWPVPKWEATFTQAIQAGFVTQDESGKWVAAPGAEMIVAPILGPLNQAHAAKQQAVQSLFQGNFYEQVYQALDKPLEHRIQQAIQQALGKYQQTTKQTGFVESFEKEHAAWLFEQKNGARAFTAKGQQLRDATEQLMKSGVTDPQQAITFALSMIGGVPKPAAPVVPAATPAAPITPEQKSEQKKNSFLKKAVARAAHSPQSRGHTTSDDPQVVDQSELDSMFVHAGRQKSGV